MKQHFRLAGSARALPRRALTAAELDARLGLPVGWTERHTGVRLRYQCADQAEADELVRAVADAAVAEAGWVWRDVDALIDASLTEQQPIPCNGALIQAALGARARGIPCFDVHASCLGFVAALTTVNGLFASEAARRVLVVCRETPLQGVNWDEPESACLMGDSVVAVAFESAPPRAGCALLMETYADGVGLCAVRGGAHRLPPQQYTPTRKADYLFTMDGKALHKLASRLFPPLLERLLRVTGRTLDAVHVVPHQASGPALEFMRRRLNLAPERFHVSIAEHGNLVAASIPFVLDRIRRGLVPGTPVMVLGTAAGYTQAAGVFEV